MGWRPVAVQRTLSHADRRPTTPVHWLETSGGAEDIESCRQKTHNTSTLDLDWGTLPSPALCPTATYVVPCENDFESTYYYSLNRHCQGVVTAQCVPCNAEEGEGEGEEEEDEE